VDLFAAYTYPVANESVAKAPRKLPLVNLVIKMFNIIAESEKSVRKLSLGWSTWLSMLWNVITN